MSRTTEQDKQYYQDHKVQIKAKSAAWRLAHPNYERDRAANVPGVLERRVVNARKTQLAKYGLTLEDYDEMFAAQNGLCAVCGKPPNGNGPSKDNLAVDHDHETGEVRGLVCDRCNLGLGHFFDDPDLLIAAAVYLVSHEKVTRP